MIEKKDFIFSTSPSSNANRLNIGTDIKEPWKIIISDDDPEIHHITKMVLSEYQYNGSPIHILSAYSGDETKNLLKQNDNIALIILDVVMEDEDTGLKLVQFIREELNNNNLQIILRTGQPGRTPEHAIITKYSINDYRSKSELTAQKLLTSVTMSLRAFQSIQRLQKELSERKKAEKAVLAVKQAKSEILANMSHEFRTPLMGIQGFADLGLSKCVRKNLSRKQTIDFFQRIKQSSIKLTQLLNTLLDLSKLESGGISYDLVEWDLVDILNEAKGKLSALNAQKEIQVETNVTCLQTRTYFDRDLILQVLLNLLSNSIKFSTQNKDIQTVVNKHSQNDEEFLKISVINYGVCIPENELKVIFEKFNQSSLNKSSKLGQGFDLSICKEIIEAHHGLIWASSTVEGETSFHFTLPTKKNSTVN